MKRTLLFILMFLIFSNSSAYLRETHIALSAEALRASKLADLTENKLLDYGLSTELFKVTVQGFIGTDGKNRSIENLMKFGSYYEDDEETLRPLNHFYDPVNDVALNIPGIDLAAALFQFFGKNVTIDKSPDWVTEDGNINIATQDFSFKDAMNSFNLALTSTTEIERKQHWGKVFQTLGQMIHHMQDMSQPQHVRNDDHCDIGVLGCFGRHDPSWYEEYTGDIVFGDYATHTIPNSLKPSAINYPVPVFPTAREFWTTRTNDTIQNRRGIADFTNRNFVSKNTNFYVDGTTNDFTTYKYAYPQPHQTTTTESLVNLTADGQAICDRLKSSNPGISFPTDGCILDFVSTTVKDSNSGVPLPVSTNLHASTYSLFSQKLNDYGQNAVIDWGDGDVTVSSVFSLNKFNHDSSHNYLIPRAISYSAGLINHFFRGKIDMTRNSSGSGWDIKNLSNEDMQGTFTVYYDYFDQVDGIEKREIIEDATWGDLSIAANDRFTVSDYITPANLMRRILVFTGRIGSEYAVTANVIQKSWGTPILISSISQQSMSEPRIGVDSIGNVVVAWEQQSVVELNIWSNRYDTLTGLWDANPFQTDAGTGNKSTYIHTELIYVGIANDTGHVIWKEFLNFSSYLPFENQLQMTTNLWRGVLVNTYPINTSNPEPPPTFVFNAPGGIVEIVEQSGNVNVRHYSADTVSIESLSGVSSDATIIANSQGKIFAAWVQMDGTDYGIYVNTYQN